MLVKNKSALVATIAVALVTGLVVALWVALMPAPAQAQPGDVLKLLSIKCVRITGDEGGLVGDFIDEPYINVDGTEVWSGRNDPSRMKDGQVRTLTGVSATLYKQSARVQLWEYDPGAVNQPDDGPAEFFVEYTGGDERTRTLTLNGGVYEIEYVVNRPSTPDPTPTPTPTPTPQPTNAPPTIDPLKPVPGSKIHNRTPLIAAKISDTDTDLARSNIKLFVDGKRITNFSYDAATDQLRYRNGKLAYGGHKVEVKATDAPGLKGKKSWSFKVVRH